MTPENDPSRYEVRSVDDVCTALDITSTTIDSVVVEINAKAFEMFPHKHTPLFRRGDCLLIERSFFDAFLRLTMRED